MPGSSLWLLPPEIHPLYVTLSKLISEDIPARLAQYQTDPFPSFVPHLTLTSDIHDSPEDPQAWLDALDLPNAAEVEVEIVELDQGTLWTKRLFLRAEKGPLKKIGTICRKIVEKPGDEKVKTAEDWVEEIWDPHISLVYMNVTQEVVTISAETIEQSGIDLSDKDASSWTGGSVWLVPTYLPVMDWKPIAIRRL